MHAINFYKIAGIAMSNIRDSFSAIALSVFEDPDWYDGYLAPARKPQNAFARER